MVDFWQGMQEGQLVNLLPEQCRAARGLLDWTQEQLAERAGVARSTVRDFECRRHELHRATEALVVKALQDAGILLIPPDNYGPGVRLQTSKVGVT
jgi:transcriptional regulator with XRE-family HTH domain